MIRGNKSLFKPLSMKWVMKQVQVAGPYISLPACSITPPQTQNMFFSSGCKGSLPLNQRELPSPQTLAPAYKGHQQTVTTKWVTANGISQKASCLSLSSLSQSNTSIVVLSFATVVYLDFLSSQSTLLSYL